MITDHQRARWQSVSDNTPPAAVPAAGEEDEATELSLDPDDWESFRRCAHAALDDAIEFVRTARRCGNQSPNVFALPLAGRFRNRVRISMPFIANLGI